MTILRTAGLLLASAAALVAAEAAIRAEGVIGNAGEQGHALIRQTTDISYRGHGNAVGCGVALDRSGTLWTRMDDAFVSRLSLDGRQLARFAAPKSVSGYDTIAMLGDRVLLLANGELAALAVDAPDGAAFAPVGLKLRALAHTPVKGRLAAITEDGGIVWVTADGGSQAIGRMSDAWVIEADGDGALYVGTRGPGQADDGRLHQLVAGVEVTTDGWPKAWNVIRPGIAIVPTFLAWCDGTFFSGGGGSVSAFDANLDPAPGTVLGMQGNHVIGVGADWRQELGVARGIVRIRPGAYVVAGALGQPFYAEWPDQTRSMRLVAWVGSRAECPALGIDADGRVFVDRLVYDWSATPDSFPATTPGGGSVASAVVRLAPRLLVRQDRWAHGSSSWALPLYSGATMQECDFTGNDKLDQSWWERGGRDQRVFPAVAYPDGDGFILLCLADASGARSIRLHGNGRFRESGPAVAFKTASPGTALTALAMRDERTLLAAIDGQVVELTRSGADWQETRRWNSWGGTPAERFGASIALVCDAGRLLVSDTQRQRVLWFAPEGGSPKAQFGRTDAPGSDLQSLAAPGLIAVCADRAVVYDGGNQRLVKLTLSGR